jgi:hypothetical protein
MASGGGNPITDQEATMMNGCGMGLGMGFGWLWMIVILVLVRARNCSAGKIFAQIRTAMTLIPKVFSIWEPSAPELRCNKNII